MNIRHKIHTALHTKRILCIKLANSFLFRYLPDKWAVRLVYHNIFGRPLNLKNPKTFNEKLQWLKLYNHNPLYTKLVDKFEVKEWVAQRIGQEYVIPTYGVWSTFDEIDFSALPDQFVLKTTHSGGSSGVIICKDKKKFDFADAKKKLAESHKTDTYAVSREWPYKDVPHRILAEMFIEPDPEINDLPDYKFFCFDGEIKALFVATERQTEGEEVKFDFYDDDFNHLPFRQGHDNACVLPKKPCNFEELKWLAKQLSSGFPHVRVDLYSVRGKVFFGEMTFFHFGGMMPFEPEEWDYVFGEWIKLPNSHNK